MLWLLLFLLLCGCLLLLLTCGIRDFETAQYQLEREQQRYNSNQNSKNSKNSNNYLTSEHGKSVLHYAVLSGNITVVLSFHLLHQLFDFEIYCELIEFLLKEEPSLASRHDIITRFTPLHYAIFVENPQILDLLLSYYPCLDLIDSFGGTPLDYAIMMGIVPCSSPPKPKSLQVFNNFGGGDGKVEHWSIKKIEEYL